MMTNDIKWKMVKLGDVAEFLPTNTLSRDELNYSEGEYLNIHYGDVLIKFDSVTDVLNSEIPFVSLNKKFSDKSLLKNGDIVMADTAEDESVGKVTEIQNIDNYKVVSGLHTLCMRFQENLFAPKFAGYYLNSPAFHNLLLPYMHGTKVTSISKGDVKKIVFPIPYKNGSPDLETQKQIAQKLGDMDSLIAAKEKLLAKKRNFKVAAMQELIKDEKSEQSALIRLGVIAKIKTGSLDSNEQSISGKYAFFTCGEEILKTDKYAFDCDAVLLGGNNATGDFKLHRYNGKFNAYQRVYVITGLQKETIDCLYYIISKWLIDLKQASTGSTTKFLKKKQVEDILIPSSFSEQRRIASILSDMDSEISAIEKEISKLQNLKTAMMQKMFCFGMTGGNE